MRWCQVGVSQGHLDIAVAEQFADGVQVDAGNDSWRFKNRS
jgi:hypothetical protein